MQLQNAKNGGMRVGMVSALGFKNSVFNLEFFFLCSVGPFRHQERSRPPFLSLSLFFLEGATSLSYSACPLANCALFAKNQTKQKQKNIQHGQIKTATSLFSTEGPRAFYHGLGPALARGVFYGGTRLGLYSPLRDAISAAFDGRNRGGEASTSTSGRGSDDSAPLQPSFGAGLAAGCLSGCAAAALTKCVKKKVFI